MRCHNTLCAAGRAFGKLESSGWARLLCDWEVRLRIPGEAGVCQRCPRLRPLRFCPGPSHADQVDRYRQSPKTERATCLCRLSIQYSSLHLPGALSLLLRLIGCRTHACCHAAEKKVSQDVLGRNSRNMYEIHNSADCMHFFQSPNGADEREFKKHFDLTRTGTEQSRFRDRHP